MTRITVTRSHRNVLLAALIATAALASVARAQIVTRFDVESVVSPDNDGHNETSRVRYTLSEDAFVSLIVFEGDGVTPVDTLRAPGPEGTTAQTFHWDGHRWDGARASEGAYFVMLYARGDDNPDSLSSLPIYVDVTAPTVQIVSVLPNPYAPGAPGSAASVSISFTVGNSSPVAPGRVADALSFAFANPGGAAFTPASLVTTPPYAGADGNYVSAWNATLETVVPADGEYRIELTLTDAAGHTAKSTYHFDVDTHAPVIKATSLAENAAVGVVPDSLFGYAFDTRGVDSLFVRYSETSPFQRVTSTYVANDTLRFAVLLADSISGEGAHRVDLRALDVFGRQADYAFNFQLDTTAPPAPILAPFSGNGAQWNTPTYPLRGSVNDGGDLRAFVRIYRDGALVDSVTTALDDEFTVSVALGPGRNEFFAVLRDGAMNASAPSNTVTVPFDNGAGLFAPAPFGPGDAFAINASQVASRCTLRIFDMLGALVIELADDRALQFYSLAWDGLNGSHVDVRKGPLVAVAAIQYGDGSRDILREVFLYDPDDR